jgi:TDG/mug DNA glycosylase family protein
LRPEEYAAVLLEGIGLTDLCKTEFGSDAELSRGAFDPAGFRAKMERFRPAAIAFDSKNAAKAFFGRPRIAYGLQSESLAGAVLFVVPSPSGRARSHWDIEPRSSAASSPTDWSPLR